SRFADQIDRLPSRMFSPLKKHPNLCPIRLVLGFFCLSLIYLYTVIIAAVVANGVAVSALLQLHVYFVPTHTVWYLSVLAAYSLAAQNAQDNDADTDNPPRSPVLSSAWSVHFSNAKAPANSRFYLQAPSSC